MRVRFPPEALTTNIEGDMKRRPKPFFYRVEEPGGSGLEKGTVIVERKGYGPVLMRMYTNTETMQCSAFKAVKVPHSEMPPEAVENAIKFLEDNPK